MNKNKKYLAKPEPTAYSSRMKKFVISRNGKFTHYNTSFFALSIMRGNKQAKPLVVFTNRDEAFAVNLERNEVADLLKRKFKNHIDRLREKV